MIDAAALRTRLVDPCPPRVHQPLPHPPERHRGEATGVAARPGAPNAAIGMLIFLGAEAMFFAGLISAYLVLRAGSATWPPPDQPRLPVAVTAVSTLLLLCSGYSMWRARTAMGRNDTAGLRRGLAITAGLGSVFLAVQGSEWMRLLHYGLGASSSIYAGTFYTVIGCHAVHVLGGLVGILALSAQVARGRSAAAGAVEACRLYWSFVVGVWPVLYVLVYLV